VNDIVLALGLEAWKPLLAALLFPPVPFLVLALAGARLMLRRRGLAWSLVLPGLAGVWLSCTGVVGDGLTRWLLKPPPALTAAQAMELRRAPRTAIVVLGGGRQPLAPEYGVATLTPLGLERLRYGLWLGRETGLPVAFSGGLAPGSEPGPTEAAIAERIAAREFGRPLRWAEDDSRDTRENAIRSVALLAPQGIDHIVVVTHAFHMRRALRNFERAATAAGVNLRLTAAPIGAPSRFEMTVLDWLPSSSGFAQMRLVLHEWLGLLAGA
jgi:uncharacterized SAM-binding protein YcdF (DUF218 family)